MNIVLWILTTVLITYSFVKDKKKTFSALKKAALKFWGMSGLFLFVMAVFSLILVIIPENIINNYIGNESGIKGVIIALGFGSISIMPGFVAFPVAAVLKMQGISLYIIAAFTLSLMTIGVVTFPIEKKFLGIKIAVIRNILAMFVCIITVVLFKVVFGE